jgi:hypothetical protein
MKSEGGRRIFYKEAMSIRIAQNEQNPSKRKVAGLISKPQTSHINRQMTK